MRPQDQKTCREELSIVLTALDALTLWGKLLDIFTMEIVACLSQLLYIFPRMHETL